MARAVVSDAAATEGRGPARQGHGGRPAGCPDAHCGSHWREVLAVQMLGCSSRLVKLASNQGVL